MLVVKLLESINIVLFTDYGRGLSADCNRLTLDIQFKDILLAPSEKNWMHYVCILYFFFLLSFFIFVATIHMVNKTLYSSCLSGVLGLNHSILSISLKSTLN